MNDVEVSPNFLFRVQKLLLLFIPRRGRLTMHRIAVRITRSATGMMKLTKQVAPRLRGQVSSWWCLKVRGALSLCGRDKEWSYFPRLEKLNIPSMDSRSPVGETS